MKKLLLLITLITSVCLAFAFVNEYSFAQSTQTYTEITGGSVVVTGNIDDTQYVVPVPFTFIYNETPVTAMSMSTNGYLGLNAGTSSFGYTAISSTTAGTGVIAPMSRDLRGRADGEMRYEVFGTSPNQYAVYQWKNWTAYGSTYVDDNWNFQVILYETSNQIAFRYGPFSWTSTYANSAQVGLRGTANTDFINRSTTTDWSATTAGSANNATCTISTTVYPPNGLQFLFAPPVAGSAPNPANLVSPADGATFVSTNPTLNWASGGGLPDGYDIYFGDTNPPPFVADLGNVTSWSPPATLNGETDYWWQVVPYNSFGDATGCPVWTFETMPGDLVQIGTGTDTTPYLPIYPYYGYTYSQVIYLQSEMGAPGMINSVGYYWNGAAASTVSTDWTVYMGHTSNDTFASATDWVPYGDLTQVFTGTVNMPAVPGWINITLNTPFLYNGSGNLVIGVDENQSGYDYPYGLFHCTPTPGVRGLLYYNDTINPDPMAPPSAMYQRSAIANVLMDVGPLPSGPPNAPVLDFPANGATGMPLAGFDLEWHPDLSGGAGVPDYYAVYMSMDEGTIYGDEYWETPNTHFNPVTEGGLVFGNSQDWFWTVEAVVTGEGSAVVDPPRRFTTIDPPPQISVAPGSLTETLEAGQTSTQQLTITNNGGLPLNFNIGFTDTTTRGSLITPFDPELRAAINPNPAASELAPVSMQQSVAANRPIFDLQFNYPTTVNQGEYGIGTDGNYFYTFNWGYLSTYGVNKYSLTGTFIETIVIPGVPGIRDVAYDGQYFYGAAATTTIYIMDVNTQTLIGTMPSPVGARGIAYDPDTDTFWVGNGWTADLRQIDRTGTQLAALTPAVASFAGLAFDNLSGPTPTLWGYCQTGASLCEWHQIDMATGAVLQTYDMATSGIDLGASSAGGAEIVTGLVPGKATLLGNTQNVSFFGLELCDTAPPWVMADPRTGTVAPNGGTFVVDIDFDSNEVGPGVYNGVFNITHNAPTAPVDVPVQLTVTGIWLPVFAIDPTTWNYGDSEQLNPVTKQFTITNTGGAVPNPLTIAAGGIYMTGDAEGNFIIDAPGLPVSLSHNQTYQFNVTFTPQTVGAKTGTLNIADNTTRVVHTVPLSGNGIVEPIGQVVNLNGVVQNDVDVMLTWVMYSGIPGSPGWIHYDDGTNFDGIGTGGAVNFDVAAKFDSGTMYAYGGMDITHIKFFPRSALSTYTLKIWTGMDANLGPDTEVYSQPVVGHTAMAWNDLTLTTPYPISGTQAVWVGYNVDVPATSDDFYPAGCDAGPAVVGYGDVMYFGGSWISMMTAYALDFNWNIQAYVDVHTLRGGAPLLSIPVINNPDKEFLRSHSLSSASGNTQSRVLRGYNVYRGGSQINGALVPTNSYLDAGLAPGTYTYTVQGVYYSANTAMSDPTSVTIVPPTPLPLPLAETWDSSSFATNQWTPGSTNWMVTTGLGNPIPSAMFSWSPQVTNYEIPLTSYWLDGTGASAITFSFDLNLNNYGALLNSMLAQVWDGSAWQTVGTVDNSAGSLPWTSYSYDITPYAAGNIFRIRFLATGVDSYDINYWYIDNINVAASTALPQPVVTITKVPAGVQLDWAAVTGATHYKVYGSNDPYAAVPWTLIDTTANLTYTDPAADSFKFYYVIATDTP